MSVAGITSLSPIDLFNANASVAKAKAQADTSSAGAGTGLTNSTAGTTFLNLLVKELQNQDPTAPMDSTAMVGQMISLNQLDQLISIKQTLSSTTSTRSGAASTAAASSSALIAARAALLSDPSSSAAAQTATAAASDPSSTLNFSSLNIPFGGK